MAGTSSESSGPDRRRPAGLGLKLTLTVGSLGLALAAAEGLARLADGGAFPYVNVFERDARYGVRLRPGASTRVRTRSGRVTTLDVGPLGFRERAPAGAPSPARFHTLLLGDSQVMGYGVEAEDTMAAQLQGRTGVDVLAAAVPSWGPTESALAAEALVPRLGPKVIVFFANVANDWSEALAPNVLRSDARDGWLTRRRSDLPEPVSFPGRAWLFGRSHLVFALRELSALTGSAAAASPSLGAPAAEQMLDQLAELSRPRGRDRSRITPELRRAAQVCRAAGCRVILAVLPIDVQVDAAEWSKYRRPARDLHALDALTSALLADARDLDVDAIDLLPTLAGHAGVFLDDDPHLSAQGHAAIAAALAPMIRADLGRVARRDGTVSR